MKLYLVQHAKAASKQLDPQRPLTEKGRRDVRKIADFLKPLNLSVGYLWHSSKQRAVQTAKLLTEVVRVNKAMLEHNGLAPNDDPSVLRDEIASVEHDVMIVGHLPFLSKLASLLLADSESADIVAFKQAGILSLLRDQDNHWQIDWMVVPELLS